MKVGQIIPRKPIPVTPRDPILKVVQIIFNGHAGLVPVVEQGKLVGIVTEKDILEKLLPQLYEFLDTHGPEEAHKAIEKAIPKFMTQPISTIMFTQNKKVYPDDPLLKAQSLMLVNKFSRIPVVDRHNHIKGVISQHHIFQALASSEIPISKPEDFYEWAIKYFDRVLATEEKNKIDVPEIIELFDRKNVYRVADLFCGRGSRDIALSRKGYQIDGLNDLEGFHLKAQENLKNAPWHITNKPDFYFTDLIDFLSKKNDDYDGILLLDNELAHHAFTYKKLLKTVSKSLIKKDALLVIQLANFEKILKVNKRFQNFSISHAADSLKEQYAFLEYYDPPVKKIGTLTFNLAIFMFKRNRWVDLGMNSVPIAYLTQDFVVDMLAGLGFNRIRTFGSNYMEPLFRHSFFPLEHDWLNIVAERK